MWKLYQTAMASALLLAAPYLLARRGRHYLTTFPGRLGRFRGSCQEGALWLHAVSVGEVGVAKTLARALPESLPLLVTTVTPTGQGQARAAFKTPRSTVTYLPFDLRFAVERFFNRFRPAALILVEGDYWPLVLATASRRGVPVAVVNGRLSQRSFPRLRRLQRLSPRLNRAFFSSIQRFGVQTVEDERRLVDLGVASERISTTGNLKYDTPEPSRHPELEATLRRLAAGRSILVAGSTMNGEEKLLLDAFDGCGGGERMLLVLAPRHPERWEGVARELARRRSSWASRSSLPPETQAPASQTDIVLLDSLGELASLYRLADIAFIGGTLVPTGGHNPLEPARFGVPVLVGPSMDNFQQIAADFTSAKAWCQVHDVAELGDILSSWLDRPELARQTGRRAAELIATGRGALDRTLELLEPLLAQVTRRASSEQR